MKTELCLKLGSTAFALLLGTLTAAYAGPGPNYWKNLGKTDTSAPSAAPSEHAVRPCTDARVVPITETKTILANGRGPTRTVEVGQKLVCTSCDTPLIVMKPSGPNGRGAMEPVAIKGTHDCTKNGCTPSPAVAAIP